MKEFKLRETDVSDYDYRDVGDAGLLLGLVSGLLCWIIVGIVIARVIH
jgi:hypothetical protein